MTAQCALKLNAQSFIPKTRRKLCHEATVGNLGLEPRSRETKIRMERELDSSALNLA